MKSLDEGGKGRFFFDVVKSLDLMRWVKIKQENYMVGMIL